MSVSVKGSFKNYVPERRWVHTLTAEMFGVGDFLAGNQGNHHPNFFLFYPGENQPKVLGYQGRDKSLIIILVSSKNHPFQTFQPPV